MQQGEAVGTARSLPKRIWAPAVAGAMTIGLILGVVFVQNMANGPAPEDTDQIGVADAEALNQYPPGDASFYDPLAWGQFMEAEWFGSVEEAARSASVVVVAEVTDVYVATKTDGVEDDPSDMYNLGIDLRPIEVVKGELPPKYRERLTVDRPLAGTETPVDQLVEEMRANLPAGPAVWMLRNETEFIKAMKGREPTVSEARGPDYWLVSSQGLFIQGVQHVENPIVGYEEPMVHEGEDYERLSKLVEYVRNVEGWHGKTKMP